MAGSKAKHAMHAYRFVVIMGFPGMFNVLTAQDTCEGWLISFANTHKLVHRGHGFEPKKAAGLFTLAAFWLEQSKITFSCSRRL